MTAKIVHFRVGNGDMTLVTLADGKAILIDCCLCDDADGSRNGNDGIEQLLARLPRDDAGRPYVDVMILTHPDQDHCRGLVSHFHLGPLADYSKKMKKIVIREMWSSPLIFRRRSEDHPLCEDATAWNTEAKRRVNWFRDNKPTQPVDGDRILILGGDEPGHTDGVEELVINAGEVFNTIGGEANDYGSFRLLAPLPAEELGEEELDKNRSSIILQMTLSASDGDKEKTRYLCGGDAAVAIWKKLWEKYEDDTDALEYDLLLTPHHCSWGVISSEPYDKGQGKPDADALNALGVIRAAGTIVSSSKTIENDDDDPPCYGAKLEYEKIADGVDGTFLCTADVSEPIEFEITDKGLQRVEKARSAYVAASSTKAVAQPMQHG